MVLAVWSAGSVILRSDGQDVRYTMQALSNPEASRIKRKNSHDLPFKKKKSFSLILELSTSFNHLFMLIIMFEICLDDLI